MKNQIYKDLGICMICKKEKSEPNKSSCWRCLERDRILKQKYRDSGNINAKKLNIDRKNAYQNRIMQGICTRCGKKRATNGRVCLECYVKRKNYRNTKKNEINRSERPSFGMCYFCGSTVLKDKKVCKICYEKVLKNAQIMNDVIRKKLETKREVMQNEMS